MVPIIWESPQIGSLVSALGYLDPEGMQHNIDSSHKLSDGVNSKEQLMQSLQTQGLQKPVFQESIPT